MGYFIALSQAGQVFLSSNTQDFIEVASTVSPTKASYRFLSSNTQDFIEVQIMEVLTDMDEAHS